MEVTNKVDNIYACRYQDTLYLDVLDRDDTVTGCSHEDGPEECIGCKLCTLYSPMTTEEDLMDWLKEAEKTQDIQPLVNIDEAAHDAVNHPNHYCKGGIECINVIRAIMSPEQFQGYCIGNVTKYVFRWQDKDGLQDLKKAAVYLNWAIEAAEEKQADYEMMDELDREDGKT